MSSRRSFQRRVGLLGAAFLVVAAVGRADDRDFVRKAADNPYVFILLDVSGSMNWTTQCTTDQFNQHECRKVCASGDCFTGLNADDPASKFYQAKEALYQVLSQIGDGLQLGFATYNQDDLHVVSKHWLYQATTPGVSLAGGAVWPPVGAQETFGRTWPCVSGNSSSDKVGCAFATPAPVSDSWSVQRMYRFPKLGDAVDTNVSFYVSSAGTTYQVTYSPVSGFNSLGSSTFKAHVLVRSCTADRRGNVTCNTTVGQTDVTYALVDQFLAWDVGSSTAEGGQGFFDQANGSDQTATNTCSGWDGNSPPESANADPHNGYDLRFPTTTDPRGQLLYSGDMIPLDWTNNHKADVLKRLAPVAGSYDQAPYFADHPRAGESFLRLVDENNRPLIANGATPLGDSIKSFRTWYAGCAQGNCPKNSGWKDLAITKDPSWGCRKKYLLVLTDGDETCGGGNSACSGTASLRAQEDILTYVVAFGVQGGGNTLTCMAANGGTGSPIYPQNQKELVDALTATFNAIKEEARSFASAAVPSVEANVADKIFLSDFTPVAGRSIWDGHFDAYLKPLPLNPDGTPNSTLACDGSHTAGCHLWDSGEVLQTQAPTATEVAAGSLKLGLGVTQRRVLYPDASNRLRLLSPPSADADWRDLFIGLGFKTATDNTQMNANKTRATSIIGQTLQIKQATITTNSGTRDLTYVLGDVFHSDPLVLDSPRDFNDFANDVNGNGASCRVGGTNFGYKCFAFEHQFRRKLVIVGTDDAQLHAFDGGTFDDSANVFTNGSGAEAFSYVPRMALPILRDDAEQSTHIYGVDGATASADMLLGDGQWHTVLVGGLREGGKRMGGSLVQQPETGAVGSENIRTGYFALDITQPDPLTEKFDSHGQVTRFVPSVTSAVPGCVSITGSTPAGCPRPFPSVLWEFRDLSTATGQPLDENGNGQADLAAPWSKPILTRIKLQAKDGSGQTITVTRFVAIVGGGVDAASKTAVNPGGGNFIYILDASTGVPLYKHQVEGAVPAVAVLDENSDNVADFIYAATTAGRVYKIDLRSPEPLVNVNVADRNGSIVTVQRVTDTAWDPLLVFRTGDDTPVYEQIQILFLARLGRFALVFGTGDREDLWNNDGKNGRLYVLVDNAFDRSTPGLPLTESSYLQVLPDGADLVGDPNLLTDPPAGKQAGWYMLLDPNERVITKSFGVSGILIFSSFVPAIVTETEGQGHNAETFCTKSGDSRNFVVYTYNGNAVTNLDDEPLPDKYIERPDFVSSPFVDQASTQNVNGQPTPPNAAELEASCTDNTRLKSIADQLKLKGPSDARYGNYYKRLGQRMSKLGVFYPACVPIAIIEKNWKEN